MIRAILAISAIALSTACARPQYGNPDTNQISSSKARSACIAQFQQSRGCVDLKWERLSTENSVGSFIFTTTDATTGLLTDLSSGLGIKVTLWMPSMGHGSTPVIVEMIAPGVFRAKEVFFLMKGDWEIRFQIGSDQAIYAIQI